MANLTTTSEIQEMNHTGLESKARDGMQVGYYGNLNNENEAKWVGFWQSCRHSHFQQHPLYGQAQQAQGRSVIYAMGEKGGRVVCAGVFCINPMIGGLSQFAEAACLRGPAFDEPEAGKEFLSEVIRHFQDRNVRCIRLCPYWSFPEAQTVEEILDELGFTICGAGVWGKTGLIDIAKSEDELFASFPKKTRYDIRRAERLGVSIRPAVSSKEANEFYERLSGMHRQRGIINIGRKEFETTFNIILQHTDIGVVFNAYYKDSFIGGLFLFRGAKTCHVSRYVVVRSFSEQVANLTIAPALLWEGIRWAKAKSCDTVDVECYEENLDATHLWHNFMKTKRDFNAKPAQIIAPHTFVISSLGCKVCKAFAFGSKVMRRGMALPYILKKKKR